MLISKLKYIKTVIWSGAICTCLISCKKFLNIDPPSTMLTTSNVYMADNTSIAVLSGIYSRLSGESLFSGKNGISALCGLTSDELNLLAGLNDRGYGLMFTNAFTASAGPPFWTELYKYLNAVNTAIEGISASETLTPTVKKQLLGEARFMRGLFYFYFTNMYNGVPLVLTSDYRINSLIRTSSRQQIYAQIIQDLNEAGTLLMDNYPNGTLTGGSLERVRPIKAAAQALLARVYLYLEQWDKAEEQADLVINNKTLFDTVPVSSVFLKNSKETILQLQPLANNNTADGDFFVIRDRPGFSNPVFLSNQLLKEFNKTKDKRYLNWIGKVSADGDDYYFPYKYKLLPGSTTVEEYLMVLRLGEQYLIRAEARARQGKLTEAQDDLNVILKRAGLTPTSAVTEVDILKEILHERQLELFTEWGHRWFDLKRTGGINEVMNLVTPLKGGIWAPYKQYFSIPLAEIQKNPNISQNEGY